MSRASKRAVVVCVVALVGASAIAAMLSVGSESYGATDSQTPVVVSQTPISTQSGGSGLLTQVSGASGRAGPEQAALLHPRKHHHSQE
jgi:hypothetical protein